jgi:hypothetical protein
VTDEDSEAFLDSLTSDDIAAVEEQEQQPAAPPQK